MIKTQTLVLFLALLSTALFGQYASVELKEKELKAFGKGLSASTLVVVINNEKDPADAALVNAVKKYWKQTPYKFMSRTEFIDKRINHTLPTSQYYIYQWFSGFTLYGANAIQITEYLNRGNTGLFLLSYVSAEPTETPKGKKSTVETTKTQNTISLSFDLSGTFNSTKDKILEGYFDLMVKYYNHEAEFCKSFTDSKEIKKEDKNGYTYFNGALENITTKDILLVKEQVLRLNKKNDAKKIQAEDAVSQFEGKTKSVFTVYPEDIKRAVEKADKKVLLYTNDMLISAENGAVYAAPGNYKESQTKPDYGFWVSAIGIMVSALAIAFSMQ